MQSCHRHPLQYFGTINNLNKLSDCQRCGRFLKRAASGSSRGRFSLVCSHFILLHQCSSTGQQINLIFDVLDGRQLRHSFLDPQSSESSSRVGVPALSHQFSHHTQSLMCQHQQQRIIYIKVCHQTYRQQT